MTLSAAEAQRIFAAADLVVSEQDAALAVGRVAGEIADALSASHPLVLSVMGGAVIFTGQLLPLLRFPLEFDYLHVTRYGDTTTGGELSWIVAPRASIAGRTVLVLDDILDEGITHAAIKRRLLEQGAKDCRRRLRPQGSRPREAGQGGFYRRASAQPLRLRLRHGRQGRLAQPAGGVCGEVSFTFFVNHFIF